MKIKTPVKPIKVPDIGCCEGKDAEFFARNGYLVTAFDLSADGILSLTPGLQIRPHII